MSYRQYIPNNEKASQLSIEPIPYNTRVNGMNGVVTNNHSLQYSPTNEHFRPVAPQQMGPPPIVDTSPLSVSHEPFQSPTQITSQMNRFHLQTPTTDCSPVFSNNNSKNNVQMTTTSTNNIPHSNYQKQCARSQNGQTPSVGTGQTNMGFSPNTNIHIGKQPMNQHQVQQQFLMQQQLMTHNNNFVPANPMNQKVEHKGTKQVGGDKKTTHSRKPSVSTSITKPSKPKKSTRSKKDSFSSLEDFKSSEVYDHDKEITIDDLLKDDPLFELTSPVALEDESNDNSLFSSFIDFEDMSQPQPNFIGLGLDLDLELNGVVNDGSANESAMKSNSSLSLYKRPSTPEQDKLIELFASPRKKSGSPSKSSSSGSNSPIKAVLDNTFPKSSSFTGSIPHSASNPSITTPINKSQPSFSLSECSNTFPVNSTTTNNYSFIIEKKSFSVPTSNSKLRRKSLPKINQKANERPVMKKTTSDASITKHTNQTPNAFHQSSTFSSVTSPKVLRNMKSGMLLFQLEINNNGNK